MVLFIRKRPSLLFFLFFCALTLAWAWAIRGQFGHEHGAAIPGVLLGISIALASPDPNKRNRLAALGVAGGLGMSLGGSMSYGDAVSMLGDAHTFGRGVLLLAGKGIIWGGIAGAALGVALGDTRYGIRDAVWAIVLTALAVFIIHSSPLSALFTGHETRMWGLLFVLFMAWLSLIKGDRSATLLATCGAIGFGVGFPGGFLMLHLGEKTGLNLDWWKVSEAIWGLCGGLAWAVGAYLIDEEGKSPIAVPWGIPSWLGLVFVVWLVPFWNGLNTVRYWVREQNVLPYAAIPAYWGVALVVLVVGAALIAARRPSPPGPWATACIYVWVLWSVFLLQYAKLGIHAAPRDHYTQVALGIVLLGLSIAASARAKVISGQVPGASQGVP